MEAKSITYYVVVMGLLAALVATTAFSGIVPAARGEESQNDSNDENNDTAGENSDTSTEENDTAGENSDTSTEENDTAAVENNESEDHGLDLSNTSEGVAACGVVVTGDIMLNEDLECDGDGLIVGASDVTINLNGYTIQSNDNAAGVSLTVDHGDNTGIKVSDANNVTIIGPGAISGFEKAITFTGSSGGKVSDTVMRDNEIAAYISGSSEVSISGNTIDNNEFAIISESSKAGQVVFNLIAANEQQGIVLSDSDEYTVVGNNAFGNGQNGIFLDAQSTENAIDLNNAFGHEIADLNNANGLPTNVNDNNFGENNNCGTSLPGGLC
jgi:parallel beta-helix repeat protein